jgi:hypothetical protein
MLEDKFNLWKIRREERDSKVNELYSAIAGSGPLTSGELSDKLDWDAETQYKIARYMEQKGLLCQVSLRFKGKIIKYFPKLNHKIIVYTPYQIRELGFRIGADLSNSPKYAGMRNVDRTMVTYEMKTRLPSSSLVVLRMHYPGFIENIEKKGMRSTKMHYMDVLQTAGFADSYELTESGLQVLEGVKINIKKGYDEFLKYWHNLQSTKHANRYRRQT